MGRLFKVIALRAQDLARGGRARIMTVGYRMATADDAERWPSSGRAPSPTRSAISTSPTTSKFSSRIIRPENWEKELSDPAFEVLRRRAGRDSWSAM